MISVNIVWISDARYLTEADDICGIRPYVFSVHVIYLYI